MTRVIRVLLVAGLLGMVVAQPAASAPVRPIAVNDVVLEVAASRIWQMPGSYSLVEVTAAGTAEVDCGQNAACLGRGLHGVEVPVSLAATVAVNTDTGWVRGRIVIDVIGAGFTGRVRGRLNPLGDDVFDVGLTIRVRAGSGVRADFDLAGVLDRVEGFAGELTGDGFVSNTFPV